MTRGVLVTGASRGIGLAAAAALAWAGDQAALDLDEAPPSRRDHGAPDSTVLGDPSM
ncbi:hypothetical protein OH779_39325 [Actinacidiphila glaucinigra]|uniref:hypothetical protein n=1 Tax=Actinacidiphila glaucinigra TaxID=235986 RepID=UPI00386424EA